MKPSAFAYFDPDTVEEALELKRQHGTDAMFLAGGLSLMPLMNLRLARPKVLIDINRVADLDQVADADGHVEIGATVRHRAVETSDLVRAHAPLLAAAAPHIGHAEVRYRGTFGGSVANADPATEFPTSVLTAEAQMVVVGPDGTRTLAASDFFTGFEKNALAPDEMLIGVRVPSAGADVRVGFVEVARRSGDRPLVAAATQLTVGEDGRITSARIGVGGIAHTPVRAAGAEAALVGAEPTDAVIEEAAGTVADQVTFDGDMHATRAYRQHVAAILTARSVRAALGTGSRGDDR